MDLYPVVAHIKDLRYDGIVAVVSFPRDHRHARPGVYRNVSALKPTSERPVENSWARFAVCLDDPSHVVDLPDT